MSTTEQVSQQIGNLNGNSFFYLFVPSSVLLYYFFLCHFFAFCCCFATCCIHTSNNKNNNNTIHIQAHVLQKYLLYYFLYFQFFCFIIFSIYFSQYDFFTLRLQFVVVVASQSANLLSAVVALLFICSIFPYGIFLFWVFFFFLTNKKTHTISTKHCHC